MEVTLYMFFRSFRDLILIYFSWAILHMKLGAVKSLICGKEKHKYFIVLSLIMYQVPPGARNRSGLVQIVNDIKHSQKQLKKNAIDSMISRWN